MPDYDPSVYFPSKRYWRARDLLLVLLVVTLLVATAVTFH